MSAYGHEMEREFSTQSIMTGDGSGNFKMFNRLELLVWKLTCYPWIVKETGRTGSHYTTEAGIYMSSFAATIFISGIVTVGVSIFSLLVALTVMLKSCQRHNSGVLEMNGNTHSYEYCRNLALHAEMNSLSGDLFPEICSDINMVYVQEGHYKKDLNISVTIAEEFFSRIRPQADGRDTVLMDADDFSTSETLNANHVSYRIDKDALHNVSRDAKYLRRFFAMKLYQKLQAGRWPLILLSRKPEILRNSTVNYLITMGCHGWSSLVMRMDNEMQIGYEEFISGHRRMLQREGFRIKGVISSQMDTLRPCLGDRIFKLPYPILRHSMQGDGEKQK